MKTITLQKCALLWLFLVLPCFSFCFALRTLPESSGVHSLASRQRFVIPADEPEPPLSSSVNAGLEQQMFDPQPPDSYLANAALKQQMSEPLPPDSYLANAAPKKRMFDPQPPDSYLANAALKQQMFEPQPPDSYLANVARKQPKFDPQPPDLKNSAGLEKQQRSYYHHL